MLDIRGIFLGLGIAIIIIGAVAIGLVQMGSTTGVGATVGAAMNSGAVSFTGFITTWVPLIIVFIGIGLAVYYLLAFLGGSNTR